MVHSGHRVRSAGQASERGREKSLFSDVLFRKLGHLHEVVQQARLEWTILVHRYRKAHDAAILSVNVVATVNPPERPARSFE